MQWLPVFLLCLTASCRALSVITPQSPLLRWMALSPPNHPKATVYHVPREYWSKSQVTFESTATSSKVDLSLLPAEEWDVGSELLQELDDVQTTVGSPALLSPDIVLISWNITWTSPQSAWLRRLGNFWPGVVVEPCTYNHLSGQQTSFSWAAVGRLFGRAWREGKLSVPLACIEGKSRLRFTKTKDGANQSSSPSLVLSSITEELAYAQELNRNVLRNQKCAHDLRLFLSLARKPPTWTWDEWEDQVATSLPWSSVPGSGPLDVVPSAEGSLPAIVFGGVTAVSLLVFASVLAPELIGQSLLGPPNYIVQPSDMSSIF